MTNNQFIKNYEVTLCFGNSTKELTIKPKFRKIVTKYFLKDSLPKMERLEKLLGGKMQEYGLKHSSLYREKTNYSWHKVSMKFTNTGSEVIENYRLDVDFEKDSLREIADDDGFGSKFPIITVNKYKSFFVIEKVKEIVYKHYNNEPLVQKTTKAFTFHVLVSKKEKHIIKIHCDFKASNYDFQEDLTLIVEPEYEVVRNFNEVTDESQILPESTVFENLIK